MTKAGGYPHPVIDGAGDVESSFEVKNVTIEPFVEDVKATFDVEFDDPTLRHLIDTGQARLSLKWRCPATLALGEFEPDRVSAQAARTRFSASFPQQDIVGLVTVNIKAVAAKHIDHLSWERQNPDYGDATFRILPGDVLADGGTFSFEPDKAYDPMRPPLESCFGFEQAGPGVKQVRIRLDDPDQVMIQLPQETFALFTQQKGRPDVQASLVVLPALTETLWHLRTLEETDESFEDRAWYRALMAVIKARRCESDDPFLQAQTILEGNPIQRALAQLNRDEEDE